MHREKLNVKIFLIYIINTIIFLFVISSIALFFSWLGRQQILNPAISFDQSKVIYPDPKLTPGDVFKDATALQICKSGYSSSVRDVSVKTKKLIYEEYFVSYPQSRGAYEVDHFIPLELGGSNDVKNLFLEPAEPRPGFHEKDIVENYLHAQVCSEKMNLKDAQEAIRRDWYEVYKGIANPDSYKINN